MKTKLTQSKRGRKKFSVGKLLSPDHDVEENLAIAAAGEFAVADQKDRAINSLVMRWPNYYAPLFTKASASRLATHKRERITARILEIITSALNRMDTKPFETFIRAVKFMQDAKRNGPLLKDAYEVLRVVGELELTLGDNIVQTVSPKDFKKQLGWRIEERQFARIKKQIGLHFPTGRPAKA
jgi:hypothetical protein